MNFPTLMEAQMQIMRLYDQGKGMTFDAIETKFRHENSSIYLFGEDPEKSKVLKGYKVHSNKPYALNVSIRASRKIACGDVESGCHDEAANLLRLKNTGVIVCDDDQHVAESEIKRLCDHGPFGGTSSYVEPYFSEIVKLLQTKPIYSAILTAKKIQIKCLAPINL